MADADADICECWGAGFSGQGTKIAVIDFGGYDYSHPDLAGQLLPGYDAVNSTPFSTATFISTVFQPNSSSHAMATCGVIAANINNNLQSAVGVAYSTKIFPIIVDGTACALVVALQKAVDADVDIVNMSFSSSQEAQSGDVSYYESLLKPLVDNGRNGKGIIPIASTGNDDLDTERYPAASLWTIGVGATDLNDLRGSMTQSNPWDWSGAENNKGSNYSTIPDLYDVVAPGTNIRTLFTQDPLGSPISSYAEWTGTSESAPLVSGIVAILLSKNPNLTYDEILTKLEDNSEEVGGYNYYSYPSNQGYNSEMFHGRVSCDKSLSNTLLGKEATISDDLSIKAFMTTSGGIQIHIPFELNKARFEIRIFNMRGQLLKQNHIKNNEYISTQDVSHLATGMYVMRIMDLNQPENIFSYKFVK